MPGRLVALFALVLVLPGCGLKDGALVSAEVAMEADPVAAAPSPTPAATEVVVVPHTEAPQTPRVTGAATAQPEPTEPSPSAAPAPPRSTEPAATTQPAVTPTPTPQPTAQPTSGASEEDYGHLLVGRTFSGAEVWTAGRPRPLVDGTNIEIRFERRTDSDVVSWYAGCNHTGGDVEVTKTVLKIAAHGSTAVGCSDERHAQDDWLGALMDGDPRWFLDRKKAILLLERGETIIRLYDGAVWGGPNEPAGEAG